MTPAQPTPPRIPGFVELWSRRTFKRLCAFLLVATLASAWFWWPALLALLLVIPFTVAGIQDMRQDSHAIRRNFPVLGRFRYTLESIRPEIRQYFVESDQEETPFSREKRSVIYSRAKNELDTQPFGTLRPVYELGYEWINHSMQAIETPSAQTAADYRVRIGEGSAATPYDASLLNISAMSYGALSSHAIAALNQGARQGGFFHNTGEGAISAYHRHGGDLVWQIGTGYFGCRDADGRFCPDRYRDKSADPAVQMTEIKLSQGAKPGHGGILPAAKVTPEIAEIRGVEPGVSVLSPPAHSAFSTPIELLEFVARLRELSGKPVGFKLCVGSRREFFGICKAMIKTGITPDFITVDGAEGGTGAAPLEFANSVGVPLNDGLFFVHNALVGSKVRERIKIIAAGKLTTGFHIVTKLALGADLCNAARPMMFALGCIQALKCNTNHCPVGVATQDKELEQGLNIENKAQRVYQFQRKTVHSVFELLAAAALRDPTELRPVHIFRRINVNEVRSYAEIYPSVEPGALIAHSAPVRWQDVWALASADHF